ncbi:SMC-Scp complex subunit ScpB [Patescibacteria group bacterium]|nr:SMC-Scp complex subunit ScpB [Patescibacteria group bacterium]MBU1673942.1 SMC-Scp complex subunit ScpB [Patescibacteria group bacterium]MBU1963936.1 SMC-Scp complex subunit ScpB [Patescibacteria group bacterium]
MDLKSQIESLLFTSGRPMAVKKLADLTGADKEEIKTALNELSASLEERGAGLILVRQADKAELATHPDNNEIIRTYLKDERTGELTRPSLETLTIIAYRGPITKAELEMIRGINCSLILRNLMIRGLITEKVEKKKGIEVYDVSMDFMKYLGISEISELPDFERLNKDIKLGQILVDQKKDKEDFFQHAE